MAEFDLQKFLDKLTSQPGVYRMLDTKGEVIYVGKAKNLKKRVSSYFQRNLTDNKTISLVNRIHSIEVTITQSENEALLLESTLIKKYMPRYNIILRDDKSYPYLYLSTQDKFPRLDYYRGSVKGKGRYFGPYPSSGAARESLMLLQKLFKIRQCSNSFFENRSRPCLQYQIKRCTAPCVNYIDEKTYADNVRHTIMFLEGKNNTVIEELGKRMEEASTNKEYELAAIYRDQIVHLRRTQEQQYVATQSGNTDVIAIISEFGEVCVEILFIRGGRLIGNKAFFPKVPESIDLDDVLTAFLPQYYLNAARGDEVPKQIIMNIPLKDKDWIESALSEELKKKIKIISNVRTTNRQWLTMAQTNGLHALNHHIAGKKNSYIRMEALQHSLHLPNIPQRMECFDISHTQGEATVASCVVFDLEGPLNSDYRRFNIKDVKGGDDYGAMRQAITRRYTRLKKEEGKLPDILVIDGGLGQLHIAEEVLEELQVSGVTILGIAKGPGRKAGLEKILISGRKEPVELKPDSIAMHLLQQIRDEAHRFAITAHRKQREKSRVTSKLEDIPGVGPKRRRLLLKQFGGMKDLKRASVAELMKVPGISKKMAEEIFSYFS